MRHALTCAAAALAFLGAASVSCALDFRGTSWLMTHDEVAASEPGRAVSESGPPGQQEIVYRTLVNGISATVIYILENDRLVSASSRFPQDLERKAFLAMKQELVARNGTPSFETENLVGWRLERTEIALALLPDGTSYVAYWEKAYFARINTVAAGSGSAGF